MQEHEEPVTEAEVLTEILSGALHAQRPPGLAPTRWVLFLGMADQFSATDLNNHDMRAFNRDGAMTYECVTCINAERERQEGG